MFNSTHRIIKEKEIYTITVYKERAIYYLFIDRKQIDCFDTAYEAQAAYHALINMTENEFIEFMENEK